MDGGGREERKVGTTLMEKGELERREPKFDEPKTQRCADSRTITGRPQPPDIPDHPQPTRRREEGKRRRGRRRRRRRRVGGSEGDLTGPDLFLGSGGTQVILPSDLLLNRRGIGERKKDIPGLSDSLRPEITFFLPQGVGVSCNCNGQKIGSGVCSSPDVNIGVGRRT